MQEEQTKKELLLDNLHSLLADVVSDSSDENPLKHKLQGDIEDLKKRWQQLANKLKSKHDNLTDALQVAESYKMDKAKIERWMMETNTKLDAMGPLPSNPNEAEQEFNKIKVSIFNTYVCMIFTI